MNEIGEKRFEQIRDAVNEVEWAEVSAGMFRGMHPEHEAETAKHADAAWAALAREHMRWLLVTVAAEKSRADFCHLQETALRDELEQIEAEKRVRQAKFAEMREAAEAIGDER